MRKVFLLFLVCIVLFGCSERKEANTNNEDIHLTDNKSTNKTQVTQDFTKADSLTNYFNWAIQQKSSSNPNFISIQCVTGTSEEYITNHFVDVYELLFNSTLELLDIIKLGDYSFKEYLNEEINPSNNELMHNIWFCKENKIEQYEEEYSLYDELIESGDFDDEDFTVQHKGVDERKLEWEKNEDILLSILNYPIVNVELKNYKLKNKSVANLLAKKISSLLDTNNDNSSENPIIFIDNIRYKKNNDTPFSNSSYGVDINTIYSESREAQHDGVIYIDDLFCFYINNKFFYVMANDSIYNLGKNWEFDENLFYNDNYEIAICKELYNGKTYFSDKIAITKFNNGRKNISAMLSENGEEYLIGGHSLSTKATKVWKEHLSIEKNMQLYGSNAWSYEKTYKQLDNAKIIINEPYINRGNRYYITNKE
jgi:hypothetical protein